MSYPKVRHLARIEGCDKRLVDFFGWWAAHGPFALTIPDTGGIRTDSLQQLRLYIGGASKARSLDQTPHGRGAAVDAHIAILSADESYVQGIRLDAHDAETRQMLFAYGELAEGNGLSWGGRFGTKNKTELGWDPAHVEVPDWKMTPYPPTKH